MYFNKTVLTLMAISLYLIPRAELYVQPKGETTKVELQSEGKKSPDQQEKRQEADVEGKQVEIETEGHPVNEDSDDDSEGQLVNDVIILQNANDITGILDDTNQRGQSCVVYYVDNTNIYDEMFKEFAKKHLTTKFVKADVFKLHNKEENEKPEIKLEMNLFKFGAYAGHVSSEDKIFIESQIRTLEKLKRRQSDNNSIDYDQEDTQIQIEYFDGIYSTENKLGLDHLYNDAIANGLFIFTYVVINTDKYDQMFIKLAEKHIKTRFIKINSTTFQYEDDNGFDLNDQPVMVFQREDTVTNGFISDNEDDIDAILDNYEEMTQVDFENMVRQQQKEREQKERQELEKQKEQEKRQEADVEGKQVEIETEGHPVDEDSDYDSAVDEKKH